jgi:hypothetical protein
VGSKAGPDAVAKRKKSLSLPGIEHRSSNPYIKGKVKSVCLTTHYAMKKYWGSGGIYRHILNLGTR